jgi:hypothetical protein
MARIRTIKPEFWTDEKVVELSAFARLLFIGLWNFCDDEGRVVYSPRRLKMQIFPSDSLDIELLFKELASSRLVEIYFVNDASYVQVCGFGKHQKIDKRSVSKIPPPDSLDIQAITPDPAESPQVSPLEGKGMEGKGVDSEANASGDTAFPIAREKLWAAGKTMLQEAGMPSKDCASFVGRLAKEYGRELTVQAVQAALTERPADPVSYLKAACQRFSGERVSAPPWYASEKGVQQKASTLGLSAYPGESLSEFKARIETAQSKIQRSALLKASLQRA